MARDAWGYIEAARAFPLTILLVSTAALYLAWLLPRVRCLWLMSKIHAPSVKETVFETSLELF